MTILPYTYLEFGLKRSTRRKTHNNGMTRRELSTLLSLLPTAAIAEAEQQTPPSTATPASTLNESFGKPFTDLPTEQAKSGAVMHPITDGKLPTGEAVEIHETTLGPGQMPHPPHAHTHGEFMLVREGTVEFTAAGIPHQLGPGGVAYAASHQVHGLKNTGTVPTTYFVIAIGDKTEKS